MLDQRGIPPAGVGGGPSSWQAQITHPLCRVTSLHSWSDRKRLCKDVEILWPGVLSSIAGTLIDKMWQLLPGRGCLAADDSCGLSGLLARGAGWCVVAEVGGAVTSTGAGQAAVAGGPVAVVKVHPFVFAVPAAGQVEGDMALGTRRTISRAVIAWSFFRFPRTRCRAPRRPRRRRSGAQLVIPDRPRVPDRRPRRPSRWPRSPP